MAKRPEILIEGGELNGRRFAVPPGGLRLGRSSSNDIHVPDEELSRNHCLFETCGEEGIRVTDLASANGTYLNGKMLGAEPMELKPGDRLEMGGTFIRVVSDEVPLGAKAVDLGLGSDDTGASATPAKRKRSPLANVLWVVVGIVLVSAIVVVLKYPFGVEVNAPAKIVDDPIPQLREIVYEKVEADQNGIFRYEMKYAEDGVLRVTIDDVPTENRHVTKSVPLSDAARATLGEILDFRAVKDIDREYVGLEPDPPALKSWNLRVVYDCRVRTISVVNTQEPDAFRTIREKLEAFSKNELGIWAIQYSRDKLVALANDSLALARSKWEDRDTHRGNLAAAISAYREAGFYLETVNPKPDFAEEVTAGIKTATEELDKRYADQRFRADRAINLGQWDEARRELCALLELVPDRTDDRHREASAKLIDVEKRTKKGGQ